MKFGLVVWWTSDLCYFSKRYKTLVIFCKTIENCLFRKEKKRFILPCYKSVCICPAVLMVCSSVWSKQSELPRRNGTGQRGHSSVGDASGPEADFAWVVDRWWCVDSTELWLHTGHHQPHNHSITCFVGPCPTAQAHNCHPWIYFFYCQSAAIIFVHEDQGSSTPWKYLASFFFAIAHYEENTCTYGGTYTACTHVGTPL